MRDDEIPLEQPDADRERLNALADAWIERLLTHGERASSCDLASLGEPVNADTQHDPK